MRLPFAALLLATVVIAGTESAPHTETTTPPADPVAEDAVAVSVTISPRVRRERRVIRAINNRRANHGCGPVRERLTLRKAARRHSRRMANHNTLSHRLPGEPDLGTRVTNAGYTGWTLVGENLAVSSRGGGAWRPRAVVRAWMNSPGHRAVMLDCRYRHIGVGLVQDNGMRWWTADFGRRT